MHIVFFLCSSVVIHNPIGMLNLSSRLIFNFLSICGISALIRLSVLFLFQPLPVRTHDCQLLSSLGWHSGRNCTTTNPALDDSAVFMCLACLKWGLLVWQLTPQSMETWALDLTKQIQWKFLIDVADHEAALKPFQLLIIIEESRSN